MWWFLQCHQVHWVMVEQSIVRDTYEVLLLGRLVIFIVVQFFECIKKCWFQFLNCFRIREPLVLVLSKQRIRIKEPLIPVILNPFKEPPVFMINQQRTGSFMANYLILQILWAMWLYTSTGPLILFWELWLWILIIALITVGGSVLIFLISAQHWSFSCWELGLVNTGLCKMNFRLLESWFPNRL